MTKLSIKELFGIAVKKGASDIHIVANLHPFLRIDGELYPLENLPILTPENTKDLAFSILSEKQKEIFIRLRELDLSYETADGCRFRVNLHWEKDNVGLVARTIVNQAPSMEDILMPDIVYDMVRTKQGLILLTGPTGCGKSTSLAAMVNHINNERACHIVTLEDPIEFIFKSKKSIVIQRQLGYDILSFSEGLKHAVRQDPNVILVGEMRDLDTIGTTITLAETGHLVLATLHTYNADQTVDRIIDVFPPYQQNQVRLQLSLFLKGIISQMLIPKIGGGRIAAREVLINTPAISNLIRENKIAQMRSTIQTSSSEGMFTIDQDLKKLYENGLITEETAKAYMMNPEALK